MLVFWAVAAVMTLAAIALVSWPLLRRDADRPTLSADEVDVALYHRRQAELHADYRDGLLDEADLASAHEELDRQLLLDTAPPDLNKDHSLAGTGLREYWPVIVAIPTIPLIAISLYLAIGANHSAIEGGGGETRDIQAMVEKLRSRLDEAPDDGEGWLMLGRTHTTLGDNRKAVAALSRAYQLRAGDPAVLVAYAQALARGRDPESFVGRPAELLEQALQAAPKHPQALWFAGIAAAQQSNFTDAARHWRTLLAQVPPESEDARIIQRNLREIEQRTQGASGELIADSRNTNKATGSASIEVSVRLSDTLRGRITGREPVFVFARAVDGPPMPLAVIRRSADQLPFTVTLDDGDSMVPDRGLSGHEEVMLIARVARSGNAAAASGDLTSGEQLVSPADKQPVAITIDSVVP